MAAVPLSQTSLITDANLKHYYKLDGNSNDSIGNANGTDTSITYADQYGAFVPGQGGVPTATGSKVLMTSGITTDLGSNFSISTWFFIPGSYPVSHPIHFCQSYVSSYSNYWVDFFFENGTNRIAANLFDNVTNPYVHQNTTISINTWHNAIITRDHGAGKFRLYVDGAEAGTSGVTDTTNTPTYNDFTMFNSHAANDLVANSVYMDDFSIFNRTLSLSDVQTIWGGGISPNTTVATNPKTIQTLRLNYLPGVMSFASVINARKIILRSTSDCYVDFDQPISTSQSYLISGSNAEDTTVTSKDGSIKTLYVQGSTTTGVLYIIVIF